MEHAHELPEFLHFLEELIEEYGILRGRKDWLYKRKLHQ